MIFSEYIIKIHEYIKYEYDNYGRNLKLSKEEHSILNGLVSYHYDHNDSINNAAGEVIAFFKLVVDKR